MSCSAPAARCLRELLARAEAQADEVAVSGQPLAYREPSDDHQGPSGLPVRRPHNAPASKQAHSPAHPAPLLCDAPARSRCRPAHHSDAAGASRPGGDDGLPASVAAASQRHRQARWMHSRSRDQGEPTPSTVEPAALEVADSDPRCWDSFHRAQPQAGSPGRT